MQKATARPSKPTLIRLSVTVTFQTSTMKPNAPVQARWANAQRAGQLSPNPPTVACNRLLAAADEFTEGSRVLFISQLVKPPLRFFTFKGWPGDSHAYLF